MIQHKIKRFAGWLFIALGIGLFVLAIVAGIWAVGAAGSWVISLAFD